MPPPPRIQKLGLAYNLQQPPTTPLHTDNKDNMSTTNVSVNTHHTHQTSNVHGLREGGGGSTTPTHPSLSPSSSGAAAMAGRSIHPHLPPPIPTHPLTHPPTPTYPHPLSNTPTYPHPPSDIPYHYHPLALPPHLSSTYHTPPLIHLLPPPPPLFPLPPLTSPPQLLPHPSPLTPPFTSSPTLLTSYPHPSPLIQALARARAAGSGAIPR